MTNYEQAAFMTAAKLGKAVGTSESTVVRFAAELGYDGYAGFQAALASWIKLKLNSVQKVDALSMEDDIPEIVRVSDFFEENQNIFCVYVGFFLNIHYLYYIIEIEYTKLY